MAPSYERGRQTARQFKVLQLLEESRFGLTIHELVECVAVDLGDTASEKTIKRDIQYWQRAGFAIERITLSDPERPIVWKLAKSQNRIPKLPVGATELLAFAAARELLSPLAGTPYWDGIQRLWEQIRENCPDALLKELDRQRAGIIVRGAAPKDYTRKQGILSALNRAIYEHRVVQILYKSLGQERPTKREIEPHAICLFDNSIYVLAPEAGMADGPIKTYKLDRISGVDVQDLRFTPRTDFDPEKTFDNSIGIYHSGQPEKFRIHVGPERADWAVEAMLHPKQRVETNGDGSVIIEIAAAYESEMIPRVLGLAGHAEVLEPASCRENVARIGKSIERNHA